MTLGLGVLTPTANIGTAVPNVKKNGDPGRKNRAPHKLLLYKGYLARKWPWLGVRGNNPPET